MPFIYHPPTRKTCEVCQRMDGSRPPIIHTQNGKASAADNFPFHNWYNFVLGYTPEFPDYILAREGVGKNHFVVDPFLGSGTTMICCKMKGIPSAGVEANDFFAFASKVKLGWNLDPVVLRRSADRLIVSLIAKYNYFQWPIVGLNLTSQQSLNRPVPVRDYLEYAREKRPQLLVERYISDAPFVKLDLLKNTISEYPWSDEGSKMFFELAYLSTILPVSNVRYGPGFGVARPKTDADVLSVFRKRVDRMIEDLTTLDHQVIMTSSEVHMGDARALSSYFQPRSVDLMITSPPYPGDHEYTKHSKLELIFSKFAQSMDEFRTIKQRMLRGSTTNIYKGDKEGELIKDIKDISNVVEEIDRRLKEDGATSGFEKLYTRLIWEYFGGMYKTFQESLKVLKPGGKFVLLVSDSHAFKMVHIETAELLSQVAQKAGFVNCHIELWQHKVSTSHQYKLFENILTVQKPE